MSRNRTSLLLAMLLVLTLAAVWEAGGTRAAGAAYVAYAGPDGDIWRVSTDGLENIPLISDGTANNPVWVPGGGQIVFSSLREHRTTTVAGRALSLSQIFVMGSDGTNIYSVSDGSGDDRFADVFPDRRSVLLLRDRNFRLASGVLTMDTQLVVVPIGGGDSGRVAATLVSTPRDRYDSFPARLSFDGSKAVLVHQSQGHNAKLVVVDLASGTTSEIRLDQDQDTAEGTVQYLWPQWTPEDQLVVLRRVYPFNPNGVMLVKLNPQGGLVQVALSGLSFEALANGFAIDWVGRTVVGARSPGMSGGQEPEEIYLISLDGNTHSAPIANGHAPAYSGVLTAPLSLPPPPAPASPTAPPTGAPAPSSSTPTRTPFGYRPPTAALTPVASPTPTPVPAPLIQTADLLFYQVWERNDRAVLAGKAGRSWTWGPAARTGGIQEPYAGAPGDQRLVQYFDKARMELNPAQGDHAAFVTSGLLVVEMLSGRIQVGTDQYITQAPAGIAVGGEGAGNQAPSYATLGTVASLRGENQVPAALGRPLSATLSATGEVGSDQALGAQAKVAQFVAQTGHNIPDVFWNFLNQQGLVFAGGAYRQDTLYDWVFTMGYPITEAYWTKQAVGGRTVDVLVQAFQRQVLTYTPSNAPVWQVQLGNVAQHYYLWRYGHAP